MKKNPVLWVPTIVWALVIFGLSVIPAEQYPQPGIPQLDKIAHSAMYAVLAVLLFRSLRGRRPDPGLRANILFTLILCLGYGILMELAQQALPYRQASLADVAADLAGSGAGILILRGAKWLQ